MITLARTAPWSTFSNASHNAKGEVIDGYTYFGWADLCGAVSVIKLARVEVARVIPPAANGPGAGGPLARDLARVAETGQIFGVLDGGAGSRNRIRGGG